MNQNIQSIGMLPCVSLLNSVRDLSMRQQLEYLKEIVEEMHSINDRLGISKGSVGKVMYDNAVARKKFVAASLEAHYNNQLDYLRRENVPSDCNSLTEIKNMLSSIESINKSCPGSVNVAQAA